MKILQTIGGFGTKGGGTSTCTYDLLSAIHSLNNIKVDILTPECSDPFDTIIGKKESWIKVVPNDYKTPLAISTNLKRYINESDYDIYHTNGMWMHVNHITCEIARKKNKPYIITPHGMLYPEALSRSYWKKWPLKKIWFDNDIREAACIHATCQQEYNHLRNFGYRGSIAVIPNPVGIPKYIDEIYTYRNYTENNETRIIGFLGRLHPRKKVENIIYGVHKSKCSNVKAIIIGKGDDGYEKFLKDEVKRLDLSEQITFAGFLNGREKFEALASLSALFVPSDFENFGMIVPEALLVGTPVMASLGTPWEELNTHNCGWWSESSSERIAHIIQLVSDVSAIELEQMGQRGRDLIKNEYSDIKVANMMKHLYQWILGKAEKPEFVYE